MRVRLMRDVEDQLVDRRVEDAVQGDRELDDAQVGAYMTAHGSGTGEDGAANLASAGQRLGLEVLHVLRR